MIVMVRLMKTSFSLDEMEFQLEEHSLSIILHLIVESVMMNATHKMLDHYVQMRGFVRNQGVSMGIMI